MGKKIYFYDTDVYESSNSFYGDSVWFAQKLCMRCHVCTLLKMIDNVMNLSLPLPAYLIFTVSFQTYIVLHNHCPDGLHHFFFISGMLWVLFSSRHLEHDAHFRCDVMIVFIWIRYCFIPHPPSLSWPTFLKLWSSLRDACICFPHLICIQEVSLNVRVVWFFCFVML